MPQPESKKFLDAVFAMIGFKGNEVRRYQAAFLAVGLSHTTGEPFGPDEVPDAYQPATTTSGKGISGGSLYTLIRQGIVTQYRGTIAKEGIDLGRRKSLRATRHRSKIQLYIIDKPALAETWLLRNGFQVPKQSMQNELTLG